MCIFFELTGETICWNGNWFPPSCIVILEMKLVFFIWFDKNLHVQLVPIITQIVSLIAIWGEMHSIKPGSNTGITPIYNFM